MENEPSQTPANEIQPGGGACAGEDATGGNAVAAPDDLPQPGARDSIEYQEELQRELEMQRIGCERFWDKIKGRSGLDRDGRVRSQEGVAAIRRVLRDRINNLSGSLEELRSDLREKLCDAGKHKASNRLHFIAVCAIDAERLTYLLLRSALGYRLERNDSGAMQLEGEELNSTTLAIAIGEAVVNERRYDLLRQRHNVHSRVINVTGDCEACLQKRSDVKPKEARRRVKALLVREAKYNKISLGESSWPGGKAKKEKAPAATQHFLRIGSLLLERAEEIGPESGLIFRRGEGTEAAIAVRASNAKRAARLSGGLFRTDTASAGHAAPATQGSALPPAPGFGGVPSRVANDEASSSSPHSPATPKPAPPAGTGSPKVQDNTPPATKAEGPDLGYKVRLSGELLAELKSEMDRDAVWCSWRLPMTCPPRPWSYKKSGDHSPGGSKPRGGPEYFGGYLTLRRPLVATKPWLPHTLELVDNPLGDWVLNAINRVQATAWALNHPVVKYLRHAWQDGSWEKLDHKIAESEGREYKIALEQRRQLYERMFRVVDQVDTCERFWFPYYMDYRGRLYADSPDFNPLGFEPVRASLRFAEGLALGDQGERCLRLEAMAAYGGEIARRPFDDRLAWFREHEAQLIALAEAPFEHMDFWVEADKPWRLLAVSLEWLSYKSQPSDFRTHLPIHVDGRCNGLQHMAVLIGDPELAAATNVLPGDHPRDLYQDVADFARMKVLDRKPQGSTKDDLIAWKNHVNQIDRGLMKNAVMTLPYGAREKTMADQMRDTLAARGFEPDSLDAPYVVRIVRRECPPLLGAMRFSDRLAEIAHYMADVGLPLDWQTPSGMRVRLAHRASIKHIVKVGIGKNAHSATLKVAQVAGALDVDEQKQGAVPCLIHSMDAAHLALTVNKCVDQGIRSFAVVHDSFATHASQVHVLASRLRQAFAEMYETDILGQTIDEWREAYTASPRRIPVHKDYQKEAQERVLMKTRELHKAQRQVEDREATVAKLKAAGGAVKAEDLQSAERALSEAMKSQRQTKSECTQAKNKLTDIESALKTGSPPACFLWADRGNLSVAEVLESPYFFD